MRYDPTPFLDDNCIQVLSSPAATRKRAPMDGFPSLLFESQDILRLAIPTECINDVCINGCIPLLFSAFNVSSNHKFAVFSTHHLTHIRHHSSDNVLWKSTAYTKFWTKDIWIIPIHRQIAGHWVLCIAHLSRHELRLFDSLGEQRPWRNDVQVRNYI